MRHVENAQQWLNEHNTLGAETAWAAIRSAVVAAPEGELAMVLASVRWLIEVECFETPELQRKLVGWILSESTGKELGPPSRLVDLVSRRQQQVSSRYETVIELSDLRREKDRLTVQLNKLTAGLAEMRGAG
jgi:hypothetical protein